MNLAQLAFCILVLRHPDGVVVAAVELGAVHLGQVRFDVPPLVDHASLVLESLAEAVLQGPVEARSAVGHEDDVGVQGESASTPMAAITTSPQRCIASMKTATGSKSVNLRSTSSLSFFVQAATTLRDMEDLLTPNASPAVAKTSS